MLTGVHGDTLTWTRDTVWDFKPKKCRKQMYYYRKYSIYPDKCEPGGKGTGKNVTGYSVSTY
jgi:hypothetical protein